VAHPAVVGGVIAVIAVFAALSLVPAPALVGYNVSVQTTLSETCLLGICSYSVQSVQASTSGPATVLDWSGWFGVTLGLGACAFSCQYKVVASTNGGQTATASESKFLGNVADFNKQDSQSFSIAYVPGGQNQVTVTLYLNGASEAVGSATLCVGC
jgi:hypothetical protein